MSEFNNSTIFYFKGEKYQTAAVNREFSEFKDQNDFFQVLERKLVITLKL